jgi:hypothetical protein
MEEASRRRPPSHRKWYYYRGQVSRCKKTLGTKGRRGLDDFDHLSGGGSKHITKGIDGIVLWRWELALKRIPAPCPIEVVAKRESIMRGHFLTLCMNYSFNS